MPCTSCGATLPDHATHCSICGSPTSANAQPYGDFSEGISSSPPTQEALPVGSEAMNYEQTSYPSVPSSQAYESQPSYAQEPLHAAPTIARTPVSPGTFSSSSQISSTSRQASSSSGLSKGMMTLLIVLALAVMSSGFGLIFYSAVYHPAQLRTQATQTVQAEYTSQAQTDATAQAQVTGTAQAYANATSTAISQATAQAQATSTTLQTIYTQSTEGVPLLNDPLAGNSASNWDTYDAVGGGGCGFSGGALHASVFQKGFYVPCMALSTYFTNFSFQIQMNIVTGDEGGVIFRADNKNSRFYYLRIGTDGNYALYLSKDSSHSTDLAFSSSPAIKTTPGQSNLITIIARSSSIYIYINKQFVTSVTDSTYTAGQIGIFAADHENGTDVAFSNAKVWRL